MSTPSLIFVAANPSIDRTYEVERLRPGEIHRPVATVAVPGGKGLNAARAAARMGGRVTAIGIVGGRGGDWVVEQMASRGVAARWIRSAAETRTCVSVLDRSTGLMTEIYERGEAIDQSAWGDLERAVAGALVEGDVALLAVSGSLPPGAPPDGFGRIARLAATGGPGGGPVAVLADSYGPALAPVLQERPTVVKLNTDEAAEATGIHVSDPASAETAARRLLDEGAGCVVVTLGLGGAVVVTLDGSSRLVQPEIRGTYPVGSGDAFLGGMAVALGRGEPPLEAARVGLAAGIANALIPGAGDLDPAAIGPILQRISVADMAP